MTVFIGSRRTVDNMFYRFQEFSEIEKYEIRGKDVNLKKKSLLSVDCFCDCKMVFLFTNSFLKKEKNRIILYVEYAADKAKMAIVLESNNTIAVKQDLFKIIEEGMDSPSTSFIELVAHESDCPLDKFPSLYEDEYY